MIDIGNGDPTLGPAGAGVREPSFINGTVRDAAAFRARIEAFQRHVQEKQLATFKRVMAEALTGLVKANPVGNPTTWKRPRKGYVGGHSRRNWQVSLATNVAEIPGTDANGAASMRDGYTAIGAIPLGTKKAFLINPVPYMERLNQGWSKQAPTGWIDAVLARVLAKYVRVK